MSRRQEAIWTAYDEICEQELGDEFRDLILTDFIVAQIAKRANEVGGYRPGTIASAHVREWLQPQKSPHVDLVAVARAMNFDWGAVANLTREEARVAYRELAEMDDPYEDKADALLKSVAPYAGTDSRVEGRIPTGRRLNWLEGSRAERTRLSQGVGRARRQATAA